MTLMFKIYKNERGGDYFFVLCCLVDFISQLRYTVSIFLFSTAPMNCTGCINIVHVTKLKSTDNVLYKTIESC